MISCCLLPRLKTCVNLRLIYHGFRCHNEAFYYFCAMVKKHTIFLLLGSNIHPRTVYLYKAIELINILIGDVITTSSRYVSEPWGFEAPVAFFNQVVCVETVLEPLEVLKKTQDIEYQLGRTQKSNGTYASRTLDIDLLFYDDETINLPALTVPHAQIAHRRFTLMPLAETAPQKEHPVLKKTCFQLLAECDDECEVWKLDEVKAHAL
ncbi:MAG: hypothetical protein IEMM0006_0357 [bacterium]|nr:MAG: hypothetical protein IEMM0006_0357 [bacterium]